jgi:integrase
MLPLPSFAVTVLSARRGLPYLGEQAMIFPSTAGTWRDPDNFRARWREVRDALGVADATSHSFRKSVATLIDDEGLSARIGADHLGHARIPETMDTYMARGRSHKVVAELLVCGTRPRYPVVLDWITRVAHRRRREVRRGRKGPDRIAASARHQPR